MILVDTSVWIENFKKNPRIIIPRELTPQIAVCPPVVQEVLQGIKDEAAADRIRKSLLSFTIFGNALTPDHFLHAADIYRSGRRRGITIWSSVDCLIAAIAIQEKISLWHSDRDFDEIAKFTELKLYANN